MEINEVIWRGAVKKLQAKKREENYVAVCLEAEMCPQCGEALVTSREGTGIPPVFFFRCQCGFSWKGVKPVGNIMVQDPLAPHGQTVRDRGVGLGKAMPAPDPTTKKDFNPKVNKKVKK